MSSVDPPSSAETHAKFIVSGEHVVLEGAPCLVYPLKSLKLMVDTAPASTGFDVLTEGAPAHPELKQMIYRACELAGWPPQRLRVTQLRLRSTIPQGAGLGSSAALCVALARLSSQHATLDALLDASRKAESVFHGRASGVDPLGVMMDEPVLYDPGAKTRRVLRIASSSPYAWVLKDSGKRRKTSEVLADLPEPSRGQRDAQRDLVKLSHDLPLVLESGDWETLPKLISYISDKHRELGLVDEALERCFESLRHEGAIATKLTGAGRGGFALGLFPLSSLNKTPKENLVIPLAE